MSLFAAAVRASAICPRFHELRVAGGTAAGATTVADALIISRSFKR